MFLHAPTLYHGFQLCINIAKSLLFFYNVRQKEINMLKSKMNVLHKKVESLGYKLTNQSHYFQTAIDKLTSSNFYANEQLNAITEQIKLHIEPKTPRNSEVESNHELVQKELDEKTNECNTGATKEKEEKEEEDKDDKESILSDDFSDIHHLYKSHMVVKNVNWIEATKQFLFV